MNKTITIITDYNGSDLETTCVEIREDADQPGKWLWFNEGSGSGSDMSFGTPEEAERNFYLTCASRV